MCKKEGCAGCGQPPAVREGVMRKVLQESIETAIAIYQYDSGYFVESVIMAPTVETPLEPRVYLTNIRLRAA